MSFCCQKRWYMASPEPSLRSTRSARTWGKRSRERRETPEGSGTAAGGDGDWRIVKSERPRQANEGGCRPGSPVVGGGPRGWALGEARGEGSGTAAGGNWDWRIVKAKGPRQTNEAACRPGSPMTAVDSRDWPLGK